MGLGPKVSQFYNSTPFCINKYVFCGQCIGMVCRFVFFEIYLVVEDIGIHNFRTV